MDKPRMFFETGNTILVLFQAIFEDAFEVVDEILGDDVHVLCEICGKLPELLINLGKLCINPFKFFINFIEFRIHPFFQILQFFRCRELFQVSLHCQEPSLLHHVWKV